MNNHTNDFLEALLFVSDSPDDKHRPLQGKTIHDFHPDFVGAVDSFIDRFLTYLDAHGFSPGRLEDLKRSLGGNVYFSLSGHGCGFWDEGTELADELESHLVAFSGKYRFEQISLGTHRGGKIDLGFPVRFLPKQRERIFFAGLKEDGK